LFGSTNEPDFIQQQRTLDPGNVIDVEDIVESPVTNAFKAAGACTTIWYKDGSAIHVTQPARLIRKLAGLGIK
jgi:hypothetical protein